MKRMTFAALLAALAFVASPVPALAGCGVDHSNADASTLLEGSDALKATNADLSQKLFDIAKKHFPEKAAGQEHGGKEHGGT